MAIRRMRVTGGMVIRGAMDAEVRAGACPRGALRGVQEEAEQACEVGMERCRNEGGEEFVVQDAAARPC